MSSAPSLHRIVVTGAAGAFGRALCLHYAGRGHSVLALDIDERRLDGLAENPLVTTAACDLTDPAELHDAIAPLRNERIAALVNAVGLIWSEPVVSFTQDGLRAHGIDSWARVIAANLTAPFVAASTVAAHMARRGGGVIINFSSVSAGGNAGQAAYSAAKAGVEGMSRAMAQELGPLGVRVNMVAPGFIDVDTTRAALTKETLQNYTARTPVRRLGLVEEVAKAVDFLIENPFVTGALLRVDGGLRL